MCPVMFPLSAVRGHLCCSCVLTVVEAAANDYSCRSLYAGISVQLWMAKGCAPFVPQLLGDNGREHPFPPPPPPPPEA